MERIDFILEQSELTRNTTLKLLREIPGEEWYKNQKGIGSSIAWQVGHLVISEFYHAIAVVTGFNKKVAEHIPLRKYSEQFTIGTKVSDDWEFKPTPSEFLKDLDFVHNVAIEDMKTLSEYDLNSKLEPTKFPHPTAEIKHEALSWNYMHEMYHCGQIGILKRELGHPTNWRGFNH